ncbi:hypothetical protein LTR94_029362, partial [Friedmanniomyces endolithicus]
AHLRCIAQCGDRRLQRVFGLPSPEGLSVERPAHSISYVVHTRGAAPVPRPSFGQATCALCEGWFVQPRAPPFVKDRRERHITFESMGLNKALLTALASTGYEKPTPIQAKSIPDVMKGKDLLGIAQTGTGKTAAFALPILHRLAENRVAPKPRTTRALILSPTRELATQIADSFKQYGAHLGFRVAVIFGGVKYGPQERALQQGLDVLVAAPGRLLDHL